MVIPMKWTKAEILIPIALLVILAVTCFGGRQTNPSQTAAAFDGQSAEEKVLVYLFTDAIQAQSDLFYGPYYTKLPTVAYYGTYVKSVREGGTGMEITFFSLPYLGPHDTIGRDEITFQVKHTGEVTPIAFRHLESYPLPDNLISLQKELPPVE